MLLLKGWSFILIIENAKEQTLFSSEDENKVLEPEIVEDGVLTSLPLSVQNAIFSQSSAGNGDYDIVPVNEYNQVNQAPNMVMSTSLLSFNAQRLLRTVIGLISDNDKPGKAYTFTIEDYRRLYKLKGYPSNQLLKAGEELGKRFTLRDPANPEEDGVVMGWIDYIRIKEGIVTVRFLPELLRVYQSWRTFSYNLGNTKAFQISYTFSFYEYCLSVLKNNTSVVFYMPLSELWNFFKLENRYKKENGEYEYSNFKRRVLKKIELDINGSDPSVNPCNINIRFKDKKSGRKVVGVTFSVSRVSFDQQAPEKVTNPFYDRLRPDTKTYYDAALAANIDAAEIERSIISYSEEGFRRIMEYNLTKNKDKSSFYWLACIRNGWVDNRSQNRFSFYNINKSVQAELANYNDYNLFVRSLEEPKLVVLFRYIGKVFSKDSPQLGDYMNKKSVKAILNDEGYMIFILEIVKDIVRNESPKEFYDWFIEWEDSRLHHSVISLNNTPVSSSAKSFESPSLLSVPASELDTGNIMESRTSIVSKLESEGITDKKILATLLEHTDEYILANIDYCVKHYRDKRRQSDISGAIISAIKNDYAGYQVELKNKIKKKRNADAEIAEGIAQAAAEADVSAKIGDATEDELKFMLEEFSSSGQERLKAIVEKESERRQREAEIQELRDYFFRLSDMEQADIFITAKTANSAAFKYAKGITSYDSMWDSHALVGFMIKATKDFMKEHPLSKSAGSLEELDARLGEDKKLLEEQ